MKRLSKIALLLSAGALSFHAQASLPWESEEPDFLPHEQAFVLSSHHDNSKLTLSWSIAAGYYMYDHAFSVDGIPDSALTRVTEPTPYQDEFFGDILKHQTTATLVIDKQYLPNNDVITVSYRGCADAGLCYPPVTAEIPINSQDGKTASIQTVFGVPVPLITYAFNSAKTHLASIAHTIETQDVAP